MYLFILELLKNLQFKIIIMSSKSAIQTQFMSFYIGRLCKFMSFIYVIVILKL